MNPSILKEWLKLTDQTRRNIFAETSAAIGLPDAAVEKDWWVVHCKQIILLIKSTRSLRIQLLVNGKKIMLPCKKACFTNRLCRSIN